MHGERQNPHSTARRVTCRDESPGPSDRRFGDRIGIKTRLGRIPMGRWWRGLNVLIVGHDTGAIRRTLDRILILEASASVALLSACSGHCYVAGASPRLIARPDEVSTGFRPSLIVEGAMGHNPTAMVCTAARAVRLYVSIAVNLRSFLGQGKGSVQLINRFIG